MAIDSSVPKDRADRPAILVEIGAGELIDKITILEIKAERMRDAIKRANVMYELGVLEEARRRHLAGNAELGQLEAELKTVNASLWTIEDDIRACDAAGDFGATFVALARAVYLTNDRRAALKKRINVATGARVIEEKSYADS